ncbi:50S ribosomal protein L23 [Patescibacteria group bacterium]|nr:50S ribosomal protein L23 [Candidatus Falkowbacteria bacterium]MBU3905444.1 50S ribosomal protein L23 [Patescibacteria group bacterium]MBU4014624.1 50S ribosomal protein L23 [Patescibacteria group bacterium]MBU4027102.1 50S ribosomal protein L23 [Patescibacteria group bacterium]MBU4073328.1 50S ribosomal protein L23 [Patescibacteria group bacterium]
MKDLYEEGQAEKVRKTAKTDKSEKSDEKKKIKKYGNAYKVLVKPLITEKATNLGAENKYVFEVSTQANKIEIAKAINEVYGIKPVNVNIVKMKGKKIRSGKTLGRRKDWKKAIIQLPEGKTIKVYEGV